MTAVLTKADLSTGKDDDVALRRIAALFAPYRWQVAGLVLVAGAQAIANVASPFLLREIIDRALPELSAVLVSWFAGGMLLSATVGAGLGAGCCCRSVTSPPRGVRRQASGYGRGSRRPAARQ